MKKIIGMIAMLFISAVAFSQKGYSDHSGRNPGTYNPADSRLASGRQGMNNRDSRDGKGSTDIHNSNAYGSGMRHNRTFYTARTGHHYATKHRYIHHYYRRH
jgi:hypothetical protein